QVRRLFGDLVEGEPALGDDADVGELHVFHVVSWNAADDGGVARVRAVNNNIVDVDAANGANCHAFRRAHTAADTEEKGRVGDVSHGDVGDGDVLNDGAIHRFEREAARPVKDHVRDGDVAEIAFGFSADFDA